VKILRSHLLLDEDEFRRFCRETEIMSTLRHPHVVHIFDVDTSPDGLRYFVMEHLDGVDLQTRLANRAALPLPALVRIVDAVASALTAAHARGIVHRDLKPANIFLLRGQGQDDDFVKVLDFGISKVAGASSRTPEFMSPEQACGLLDRIDARTDQFALAAITYAMLTGRPPFVGDDPAALLSQVVHAPPPPLADFVLWDAAEIQSVLDRALAKRQEDRFDSVMKFAWALRVAAHSVLRGHPRTAVMPRAPSLVAPSPVPRELERVRRGPERTVALGLAVVGLAVAITHQGWYWGFAGRAANLERGLVSLVRGQPR
jgi:serine/threonine protein kinase